VVSRSPISPSGKGPFIYEFDLVKVRGPRHPHRRREVQMAMGMMGFFIVPIREDPPSCRST